MPHHQPVGEDLEAEVGLEQRAPAAVEADRHAEPLALGPEGVVVAVVPGLVVHAAGRQEDGLEAVLVDGAARLGHRGADVVGRHHRGAVQARGVGLAVVLEPVVVGARDGGREVGLEAVGADLLARVEPQHEEAARREEDREIHALALHRVELRLGAPALRLGLAVRLLLVGPPADARALPLDQRPHRTGAQQHLALELHPDVAPQLGHAHRRGVPVLGRDVALPQVGGLHHVHVRVGDGEVFEGHGGSCVGRGRRQDAEGDRLPPRRAAASAAIPSPTSAPVVGSGRIAGAGGGVGENESSRRAATAEASSSCSW